MTAFQASNGECPPARRCGDCSGPYGSGTCWPLKNYTTVFVDEYGSTDSDVDSIKKEIYARGPVSAGINAIPVRIIAATNVDLVVRILYHSITLWDVDVNLRHMQTLFLLFMVLYYSFLLKYQPSRSV